MSKKVAVIMGSDSDFPVVSPAIRRLKQFGIPVEARVMSAHRTPEAAAEFSKNAEKDGFGVIIAAAGKAAHLAGVLAAHTTLPVIGIPVKSSTLDGLDAGLRADFCAHTGGLGDRRLHRVLCFSSEHCLNRCDGGLCCCLRRDGGGLLDDFNDFILAHGYRLFLPRWFWK